MKITVIVAKMEGGEMPWILGAWDEYTIDENYKGFCDAVKQYQATMPKTDIRTAQIEVSDGFLESIYQPIKVNGRLVGPDGADGGGPTRGQGGQTKGEDGGRL